MPRSGDPHDQPRIAIQQLKAETVQMHDCRHQTKSQP